MRIWAITDSQFSAEELQPSTQLWRPA